jgi:hypothetical protein
VTGQPLLTISTNCSSSGFASRGIIWLRRRNKLGQAVSYYRAGETRLRRSTDADTGESQDADRRLPFDYERIGRALHLVNEFDSHWESYFRQQRARVLVLFYEHFVENYVQTVHKVLDFVGIGDQPVTLAPPHLQRQSDLTSLEWQRRFLELHQAAGRGQARVSVDDRRTSAAAGPKKQADAELGVATSGPQPITAYAVTSDPPRIALAGPRRDWMDATHDRFAYRCLPMVIANQAGWLILNCAKFAVTWSGGPDQNALRIDLLGSADRGHIVSQFGSGILTFHAGYLFRTPLGYNLRVGGPANYPKDGVYALEGIVEADWPEATFTMNWKVTRPNHPIVFEEGEPIAMVTPVERHLLERFRPDVRNIADDPELEARYREWSQSRNAHNADLKTPGTKAHREGWQRHYMRGRTIREEPAKGHQTSLDLQGFVDKRR